MPRALAERAQLQQLERDGRAAELAGGPEDPERLAIDRQRHVIAMRTDRA